MSKKHFIAFAKIAYAHRVRAMQHKKDGRDDLAMAAFNLAAGLEKGVIEVAEQCNERFDRQRFIAACTPEGCPGT